MATYAEIKQEIQSYIITNGNNLITAQTLNSLLNNIVDWNFSSFNNEKFYITPNEFIQETDVDDTESLQRAFNYAEENNVAIKLSGIYTTRYTVLYGSNIRIFGNGCKVQITNPNIGAVFASKSFYSDWYSTYGSTKNVKISDIEFIIPPLSEVAGIGINRGENITIDGCISKNMKSHLVDITGKNILVRNCKAYNTIQPNAPYQVDNLEVGNGNPQWITDSTGASVSITNDGFQSEDVVIEDNYAFDCYHAVHIHRQNSGKKSYVTVRNNRFFNSEIPFYCDPSKTWDGVNIEGNLIYSNVPRFQAILAEGIINNLNIKNNIFYNYVNVFRQSSVGASWIGGSFESNTCFASASSLTPTDRRAINIQRNLTNVTFVDNTFDGFDRCINSNSTAVVSGVKIINNDFRNIKERAIGLDKATDFVIKSNKIQSVNKSYDLANFTSTSWRTYSSDFGIAGIVINDSSNGVIESNTFNDLNCVAIGLNTITANNISIKDNTATNSVGFITTIYNASNKLNNIKITDNKLNSIDYTYTLGYAYIISANNLTILNNIGDGIIYNGVDIRESNNISINENIMNGGFSSGTDKKAFTFTTCTNVKYKNNSCTVFNTIANNYELFINGCIDSEFYCTKFIGWSNPSTTTNCRFFYNSNNLPTGSQVGRFGVGSIITNDNNTGGIPTGEPQGWVCIVESDTSTFTPFGQLGFRSTSGNPNSNNITSFFIGEEIFDTSLNRFWKSISTSSPTSTTPTWMLITQDIINAQFTIDPPSINAGSFYSQDFTVVGAIQGMFVNTSITGNAGNLILNTKVIGTDTIRLVIFNPNSSPIDYGSSTVLFRLTK